MQSQAPLSNQVLCPGMRNLQHMLSRRISSFLAERRCSMQPRLPRFWHRFPDRSFTTRSNATPVFGCKCLPGLIPSDSTRFFQICHGHPRSQGRLHGRRCWLHHFCPKAEVLHFEVRQGVADSNHDFGLVVPGNDVTWRVVAQTQKHILHSMPQCLADMAANNC